ncbi:MAG: TolC family protein [Methanothrix sp.]|nr:TolC family protein [Methanothrix sp.]
MYYKILVPTFALILVSALSAQKKETIDALISEALNHNPQIAASLYSMGAAQAKIPQASSLDDPELIFKLMEIPGTDFNRAMYANIELMQMIRFPSKLSTQRLIAETRAEHAHHDHMEKVLDVVADLRVSYAELRYARRSLELNLENQQFLTQIVTSTTTQYSVGKASQQDVLKSTIELAKLKAQEEAVKQEVIGAESMLRAILNRPSGAVIGPLDDQKPEPVTASVQDLVNYAMQYRPMLVHDSLNVYESSLSVDLMKKEYLPDFKVSLEYVRMPTLMENRWSVSAGITLPFAPWTLSKASSRVQEATEEKLSLASTFEASKRMVEAQIKDSYAKVSSYRSEMDAYETTVLPQTEQSLQSLLREYQSNQTSFLMLLDSYRMKREAEMEAAMARMKYEQAVASLERFVGNADFLSFTFQPKDQQP